MLIEVNEDDLKSGRVVVPGWYRVLIEEVEDRQSKDNQSTNSWLKGKILYNADNGSKEFADVPTPYLWMLNSKGKFAFEGLFRSLGHEWKLGARFQTSALVGVQVEVFIENELFSGVMQNKMTNKYRVPRNTEE